MVQGYILFALERIDYKGVCCFRFNFTLVSIESRYSQG